MRNALRRFVGFAALPVLMLGITACAASPSAPSSAPPTTPVTTPPKEVQVSAYPGSTLAPFQHSGWFFTLPYTGPSGGTFQGRGTVRVKIGAGVQLYVFKTLDEYMAAGACTSAMTVCPGALLAQNTGQTGSVTEVTFSTDILGGNTMMIAPRNIKSQDVNTNFAEFYFTPAQ